MSLPHPSTRTCLFDNGGAGMRARTYLDMGTALRSLLRCPGCRGTFDAVCHDQGGDASEEGWLRCRACGSTEPVRRGIPRLLDIRSSQRQEVDEQTRQSFSFEWALHHPQDGTWGMTLEERTKWYFLGGVGLQSDEVA